MAKKKRKRVDYDSPLTSIYSPEYQYLMKQNAPENANVAGLGDWFSNLFNRNKQQPDFHRDTVSMGLGTENSLQGVGNGGIDWNNQDFSFTGQSNQQQFDYNPNSELNKAQQYQLSLKDPENLAPKQNGPNEQKKQNEQQPNTGSNINWGGIIGAAGTSAANAIQEGGSAADIAAGIMGIPVLAKMWKANTEWGDARIKEAQEKLTNPSIKFIQDANDTQGAGQGIKLNNQKNLDLIDTSGMLTTNNWKKFSSGRGSGTWWKNMATAQLQGAAAGSVGGPWGALGGATAGLLGSIGGLFGSKRRAKRAMNEYNRKITDIRTYANAENFRKIAERDLSNKNMLSNGLNQQNLQDMSNFKAFGGNLYPDGGNLDDDYVYEGGILPEVSIIEEAMPWYEKWYNKGKRALGRGWENVKKAMATPTMTALPGQSPTFQGQFFPTMPSTVGDDLEYALSIVSAPWDMEGIGQAAWVLKHPKEAAKLMKQPVDKLVDWAKRKTNKEYQSIANRANSTEDALALTKDRLRNGGFDRLENAYNSRAGKSNKWVDDTDSWVSDNSAINLEYGNRINKNNFDYIKDIYSDMNPEANWAVNVPYSKNRLYSNTDPLWINHNVRNNIDELHYPNELRQQLLDLDVMEIPSSLWGRGVTGENVGVASYGKTPAIFTDRPAKYANNSAKNQLSAHEYAHTVYYPDELPKNVFNPKSKYLKSANGAELNARGTQIKNYFGLKEGEPLTADHLKYAKNHMTKDLGYDNNMTEFFESIKDYKRAAKWLNEHSPAIGGITTGIGVLTNLDDEQNINAMGGNLYPDGGTIKEGNEEVVQKPVYEGGELPEIEVIGYEYPAYEPTNSWNYPETADPESVEWLANWLDKRRPQLYNNLQNILYSNYLKEIAATRYIPKREKEYDFYTFVPKNKEVDGYGITKEEDFDRGLLFNETPFHGSLSTWFNDKFGDGSYRKNDIDIIYNNQIHNAASATEGGQNTMYQGTTILGDYAPARGINSWDENSRTHTVSYNPDFYKPIWDNEEPYSRIKKSVRLHERTHASNAIPQEETISKIMENAKDRDGNPIKKDKYLDKDTEIYSRLMEERYRHNLNPTKTITKKDLEQMREESKNDSPLENHNILNRYDDETLLRLFNEVAKGNNDTKKYSNVAAMGGNLYTDLSPNMMNLWNDKQNIDKQKVNTQQMNFGLGNSFNQKLNTFDYGGSMNGMDLPTNMQSYENGGTHEQNPNGGIQVGVDQQGNPNLVEEGEFRWGDYVFSDRIEVDPDVLSMYNIASSKSNKKSKNKPSYADMAKKYADKNKELVNDPISKNSLNAYMDKLQKAQEDQKYQEQLQAQQDQQLADYRNALKSPAQSNPMYGSMKYNGLGNANQGLNTGTDEGMGNPMDSSDLSNVNRSGNAMMAAYGGMFANGGNLYPYGGYSRTPEDDAQLSFVRPLFNIDNYQNDWTNNNSGNLVRQGGVYDPYDLSVNPNPNLGLNPYEQRYTDKYVDEISKGDPRVRQQILQDDGLYDGKIDGIWGKKSKVAWDEFNKIRKGQYGTSMAKSSTPPVTTATSATSTQPVTTTTSTSPVAGNKTYSSTSKSFGYSGVNEEAKREYDDKNKYESSNGTENISVTNGTTPQLPVETRGILRNEQAGLAGYSPIDFNKYSEAGKYGLLAEGLAPNLMNWTGQTNWDYDLNWRPSNELEALGNSSYASRIADHLGDYIAPNLMDLERLNNASQAQAAANARAIQNVANGRATGLASLVANDYNSQMGIGNNYATTEQYNADQKQKAAEFNRATNQFNAQANNDMYRDKLNAWMQGRQMDIQAMEAANRERQFERQYKDKVDRDAALNKQQDLAAMFDNQMNFLADEAKYNRDLNMLNSRRNNRFYYDKDNGWQFRGDNGYASDLNEYMTGRGVVLTSDDLKQIKQLDEDYGFGEESKAEKLAAAKSIIDRRKEVQDKEFADKATKEDEDLRFKAGKASEIHKTLAALQDDKGNNIYGNLAGNDIYGKYLDRDLYDEYKKGKISKQDLEYYIEAMKDVERQYNNYHFSKYNNKVNTGAYGGKLNNRKRGDYYYMNV